MSLRPNYIHNPSTAKHPSTPYLQTKQTNNRNNERRQLAVNLSNQRTPKHPAPPPGRTQRISQYINKTRADSTLRLEGTHSAAPSLRPYHPQHQQLLHGIPRRPTHPRRGAPAHIHMTATTSLPARSTSITRLPKKISNTLSYYNPQHRRTTP